MPCVTTERIRYGGSILFQDVVIEPIPQTFTINGLTLHRKSEFHITLTNHHKLAKMIDASKAPVIAEELLVLFKEYIAAYPIESYEISNRFYFVQSDTRKTIVCLAKVPALKGFFAHVRRVYGVDVPAQPTHVTLYTLLPDKIGIGIQSKVMLAEIGKKVRLDLRVAPEVLTPTKFGNPILRQTARKLSKQEILSPKIQQLIADIRHTVANKPYGVGLAAQQVGEDAALSLIAIKATPTRPDRKPFETVLVNPEIVETYGRRAELWEGCISCGQGNDILYAKVPRYKKIKLRWLDERAKLHEEVLEGLIAHVAQHETDHTNGILFVDRVKDTTSYMMADEYRKRIARGTRK